LPTNCPGVWRSSPCPTKGNTDRTKRKLPDLRCRTGCACRRLRVTRIFSRHSATMHRVDALRANTKRIDPLVECRHLVTDSRSILRRSAYGIEGWFQRMFSNAQFATCEDRASVCSVLSLCMWQKRPRWSPRRWHRQWLHGHFSGRGAGRIVGFVAGGRLATHRASIQPAQLPSSAGFSLPQSAAANIPFTAQNLLWASNWVILTFFRMYMDLRQLHWHIACRSSLGTPLKVA